MAAQAVGASSRPAWEVGVSLAYLLDFARALPPNMSSGEVSGHAGSCNCKLGHHHIPPQVVGVVPTCGISWTHTNSTHSEVSAKPGRI